MLESAQPPLYDVVAVEIATERVLWVVGGKTAENADAVVCMAVARRGVGDRFFVSVRAGLYHEGDTWMGRDAQGKRGSLRALRKPTGRE